MRPLPWGWGYTSELLAWLPLSPGIPRTHSLRNPPPVLPGFWAPFRFVCAALRLLGPLWQAAQGIPALEA